MCFIRLLENAKQLPSPGMMLCVNCIEYCLEEVLDKRYTLIAPSGGKESQRPGVDEHLRVAKHVDIHKIQRGLRPA